MSSGRRNWTTIRGPIGPREPRPAARRPGRPRPAGEWTGSPPYLLIAKRKVRGCETCSRGVDRGGPHDVGAGGQDAARETPGEGDGVRAGLRRRTRVPRRMVRVQRVPVRFAAVVGRQVRPTRRPVVRRVKASFTVAASERVKRIVVPVRRVHERPIRRPVMHRRGPADAVPEPPAGLPGAGAPGGRRRRRELVGADVGGRADRAGAAAEGERAVGGVGEPGVDRRAIRRSVRKSPGCRVREQRASRRSGRSGCPRPG